MLIQFFWNRMACCLAVFVFILSAMGWVDVANADVQLPHVFSDHMVLQQGRETPIWGKADPGETVTVRLGQGPRVQTQADEEGRWMLRVPTGKASRGPTVLRVTASNKLLIRDVLIGEVWLCSGQSNMEWELIRSTQGQKAIDAVHFSRIRHFKVPRFARDDDPPGAWTVSSPQTVSYYTAGGYFFARRLHEKQDVPVGLLNSSLSSSRIEPWTPPVGFARVPDLELIYEQVKKRDRPFEHFQEPTVLYDSMIRPIEPYGIRGVIWYQGEANHSESDYVLKTRALVEGWRQTWQADLPYYYVQIAPYHYGDEDPELMARFWEQQARVEDEIDDAWMVVISDVGDVNDVHPRNKQAVGLRLANRALVHTYGVEGVVDTGPRFKALAVEEGHLRVSFEHPGTALASRDGKPLSDFQIIGQGTGWEPADAVIEGNDVLLSSMKVSVPVAVRFAWHKLATPNLMNKAGLPAAPFRVGDVPTADPLAQPVQK